MVFRNSLFYIDAINQKEDGVSYAIHLNPEHIIYKAHFPGKPITPGVCILKIGLELLSAAVDCELDISSVKNVKFLRILQPDGMPVSVEVQKIIFNDRTVKAQIEFHNSESSIAKMSFTCQIAVE